MSTLIPVRVRDIQQVTPLIREFTLEALDQPLPAFSSGSHVVVQLPLPDRILRNAYSLTNDPAHDDHYKIAVRLQDDSRGGSRFLHEQVMIGDVLNISAPLNLFALHSQAHKHVFIAGGIGITPFLAHIRELMHTGQAFELHYACRDQISNAYETLLTELFPEQVHIYSEKTARRLDVMQLLQQQSLNSHVYVCGPERLTQAVQDAAQTLGWSKQRVHAEAFAAPPAGAAFTAYLTQSQQEIEVPSDYSLLEALEKHEIPVTSLCRGGVCGQCATKYTGDVEHHDHYLNPQEREQLLMPCVSRGKQGCRIELEL